MSETTQPENTEPEVIQTAAMPLADAVPPTVAASVEEPAVAAAELAAPGAVEAVENAVVEDASPVDVPSVEDASLADLPGVEAEAEPPAAVTVAPPVAEAPAAPISLDLDELPEVVAASPDLEAVEAPKAARPIAGPSDLNLGDAQQVAQVTYGQTQQVYAQPSFSQPPMAAPTAPPMNPGYAQQPLPGYPSAPSAPQPRVLSVPPSAPLSWDEENTWASSAHWSALVASLLGVGFAGPLLVYLLKGPQSARVRAAAAESLNFEITFILSLIASAVATVIVIGLVGFVVFPLAWLILRILAAVAASRGEDYRYPVALRLVK